MLSSLPLLFVLGLQDVRYVTRSTVSGDSRLCDIMSTIVSSKTSPSTVTSSVIGSFTHRLHPKNVCSTSTIKYSYDTLGELLALWPSKSGSNHVQSKTGGLGSSSYRMLDWSRFVRTPVMVTSSRSCYHHVLCCPPFFLYYLLCFTAVHAGIPATIYIATVETGPTINVCSFGIPTRYSTLDNYLIN